MKGFGFQILISCATVAFSSCLIEESYLPSSIWYLPMCTRSLEIKIERFNGIAFIPYLSAF